MPSSVIEASIVLCSVSYDSCLVNVQSACALNVIISSAACNHIF
jgi:hypothetical protein